MPIAVKQTLKRKAEKKREKGNSTGPINIPKISKKILKNKYILKE